MTPEQKARDKAIELAKHSFKYLECIEITVGSDRWAIYVLAEALLLEVAARDSLRQQLISAEFLLDESRNFHKEIRDGDLAKIIELGDKLNHYSAENAKLHTQVQELGNEYAIVCHWKDRAEKLEAENARLRAALTFYANKENHNSRIVIQSCGYCSDIKDSIVSVDNGQIARHALSSKSEGDEQ